MLFAVRRRAYPAVMLEGLAEITLAGVAYALAYIGDTPIGIGKVALGLFDAQLLKVFAEG
jgi:hypothetical protein